MLILSTRTCKIDVWVSRIENVVNHTKRETTCHHYACCITHFTHHFSCFTQWWVNGNLDTLHSCKQYNTHSPHFTSQTIFLEALLLMQTEQLCDCIHYLTKHMYMEAWVKIVDSILHHQKWISKITFTCLLYTQWQIFYTSLCTVLCKLWHITWRMLSITFSFSIYTPSSYDHISLLQTLKVH
jgi:hypothetical protein